MSRPSFRALVALLAVVILNAEASAAPNPATSAPSDPFTTAQLDVARSVRERALEDDTAYELLRSLTSRVGPRSAGSPGDARAVEWAQAQLKSLGFVNVHAEPVRVPHWVRGECHVETVSPWPQRLVAEALGGSIATPESGLEADVIAVSDLDEMATGDSTRFTGRIVFFSGRMERRHDGAGYSKAVAVRGRGAIEAARRGALAVVIRSVGTDRDRVVHTGAMRYDPSVTRIPALALSNPDADLLVDQLASGERVRMRLRNTSAMADSAWSANVVGEIPGRERPNEVVVLGGHLDSWDLGTGAHDDGTGVCIMTAAARLIGQASQRPRRTIRVVMFANEEFGLSGARTYARDHAAEAERIVFGMESDLGAFQPLGLKLKVAAAQRAAARVMHSMLQPLGIEWRGEDATGDADVGQLLALGVPVGDLETDASDYFDLHHTANDTFEIGRAHV